MSSSQHQAIPRMLSCLSRLHSRIRLGFTFGDISLLCIHTDSRMFNSRSNQSAKIDIAASRPCHYLYSDEVN